MSTISAGTTTTTGYVVTSDTTGALVLKTGASGTTAVTVGSDQSVTFAGSQTFSGGTANGVLYLNGSKAATSGSGLVFDGTNLGIGTASPTQKLQVKGAIAYEATNSINVWQIYNYTDNTLRFNYNGVGGDELILDTSGNLGLGVTPSAWGGGFVALEGNGFAVSSSDAVSCHFSANAYRSSSDWIYKGSNFATRYRQLNGTHAFFTAPSGTAGNAITFTQAMTLDASGNLLVGTTSAGGKLHVRGTSAANTTYRLEPYDNNYASKLLVSSQSSGDGGIQYGASGGNNLDIFAYDSIRFFNGTGAISGGIGTEKARITSAGNLGIGTSTPQYRLSLGNTIGRKLAIYDDGSSGGVAAGFGTDLSGSSYELSSWVGSPGGGNGVFTWGQVNTTNGAFTERMRINTAGYLLVGVTATAGGGAHCIQAGSGVNSLQMQNNGGTPYGPYINFSAAAPNNASQYFIMCADTSATRVLLYSNGGIANYQANNSNLSDRREKTNFAPATSYLDKICAIPVQTFNYIDQNLEEDDGLTLGVVAQDVQAVAPELVHETDWGTQEEPKMRLSIYQTDLQYALMKCIQEQQALIESLTQRIAALEGTS